MGVYCFIILINLVIQRYTMTVNICLVKNVNVFFGEDLLFKVHFVLQCKQLMEGK
jgi:hypothetical protein